MYDKVFFGWTYTTTIEKYGMYKIGKIQTEIYLNADYEYLS